MPALVARKGVSGELWDCFIELVGKDTLLIYITRWITVLSWLNL
jgi:hypothetical protein